MALAMVMDMRGRITILAILIVMVSVSSIYAKPSATEYGGSIVEALDIAKVEQHARKLSSLGSRVVGYQGYYKSVDYIIEQLNNTGLPFQVQNFSVVSPIEEESFIEVEGKRLRVHVLWPNAMFLISPTHPEGVTGKLVYAGRGEASEIQGKEINGSIVLMDFNSLNNWLRVADLGAKAVVFLEPEDTDRYEALTKFTSAPVFFSRVYATKDVAKELLASEGKLARLVVRAEMRKVNAYNIVVKINGSAYPNDVIVVATHYDAWSIVPSISEAFSEALNPALLLELARVFAKNPPPRSIWLAFLSGFYQGLAGSKAFVEEYFYSQDVLSGRVRLWMMIGLQLSDESPRISSMFVGHGLRYGAGSSAIAGKYTWVKGRLYEYSQSPQLLKLVSKSAYQFKPSDLYEDYLESSGWWGTQQVPYMLISEPAAMAGTASFSFKTAYYRGLRWGIPTSDSRYVAFDNFRVQAQVATFMISSLAAEDAWGLSWGSHSPVRFTVRVGAIEGFVEFKGEVAKLDPSTGWYHPVPGAIVRVYPEGPIGTFALPFSAYLTFTDSNGTFRAIIGPRGSTPTWLYDAWVVDSSTGRIILACDRGPLYGQQVLKSALMPLSPVEGALIPVFEARSITVFRVLSPSTLRRPVILDPRMPTQQLLSSSVRLEVYDYDTKGIPYFYGYWYDPWGYPLVVFGMPGARLVVNLRVGGGWPELVLVNASGELREGSGLLTSEDITITASYLRLANDILLLAEGRYEKLKEKGVRSLSAEELLSKAKYHLVKAVESLKAMDYEAYEAHSLAALAYSSKAYKDEVMPLYDDAGKSGLAILVLLVPAALLLERLIFHAEEGKSRLVSLLMVGVLLTGIFYVIHPALSVLVSTAMSIMGVLLVLLFTIAVVVLGSEAGRVIEEEAEKAMGIHKVGRSPALVTVQSLPIAVENMRKRPLRTALTLAALIATVIAVTSLTSISYYTDVKFSLVASESPSEGLLVKRAYAVPLYDVLDEPLLAYLKATAPGFELRPRAWSYPSMGAKQGYSAPVHANEGYNLSARVSAVLGLSGRELTEKFSRALVAGPSPDSLRLLFNEEAPVCLLPKSLAETLRVKVGDYLSYAGLQLTVVGIFDEAAASAIKDLDGMSPAPIKPEHNTIIAMQPPGAPPSVPSSTGWSEIIVAPYRLTLKLGGYLASVDLKPLTGIGVDLINVSKSVTLATDLRIYAGSKEMGIVSGTRVASYLFLGWEIIPVVLIIGALNMTMTLLGNLKERVREVYVFTAVGLSPLGSALMYMTEALTYALVAVVSGYVLGFLANRALASLGVLPTAYALNYASTFLIVAFAVLILSTLAASLYPSLTAATLITPSLERRWKPPTKPRGDTWEIPVPVRFPSKEEALGSLFYIYEYFTGLGKEKPYFIVREAKPPTPESPSTSLLVALAPYELGVTQEATILFMGDEVRRMYTIMLKLQRLTGARSTWESNNYYFIDEVRKQALMWRALPPEKRLEYMKRVRHQ
ncbi:MAG: M28 family peptidase [Thermofilaceae archaeon]|nr:M28 family peptidase [Thermofilaceae archaeon]MCX8180022.1 M28 family peptidase [Thermofilaceae archaeon]MDW8003235.1 FtsX-like permease family protein [Thermofilaceae archaeon]